jgi:thioredoxin reductase (NADPH)
MRECDVVVLGCGMAGLTAGMVAAQHGLSVLLVDQMGAAGQVLNVDRIENMPGFPDGIPGYELGPLVQTQAEAAGCDFAFDTATGLDSDGNAHILRCAEEDIRARAVIIAGGSRLRDLGLPGEARFEGKGLSHCASCDGAFFAGQTVAVVGGGDSAIEEATVLTEYAEKVLVLHRGSELDAQRYLLAQAEARSNIEVVYNTEVEEIVGDDLVAGLRLRDTADGSTRNEPVAGVFVYVGLEPNTAFLREVLDLDPAGHIVTDIGLATSVPGVFAAGDIRRGSVSLVASAIGDGATAAVNAFRYLNGR